MLGVLWSIVGAVISRALLLGSSVVCARILGRQGFGEFGMVQSTAGMFGVFAGLGLGLTATKYVAEFRKQDPNKAGRIIALSEATAFLSGCVITVSMILLAPFLAKQVLHAPGLAIPLAVGSGLVFFGAINGAQTGALAGFEAFKTIARVNVLAGVAAFPLIVLGVWSAGLQGAVWGSVAALAVSCLLNNRALRRECANAKVPRRFARCHGEFGILYRFSLPALLASMLVGPVIWACNAWLVCQPNGYGELGTYTAADKFRLLILFVPTSVFAMVLPVLSNLYGEGDNRSFQKIFRANLRMSAGLALLAALLVALFAAPIMAVYGSSFRGGRPVLIVLAISAVPEALNAILGQPLIAARRMWSRFAFDLLLVVVLAGLAWVLIPRWGALGLATSYGVAYTVTSIGLFLFLKQSSWMEPLHE